MGASLTSSVLLFLDASPKGISHRQKVAASDSLGRPGVLEGQILL